MTDIKTLNDNFRRTFSSGKVMLTCGINAKSQKEVAEILNQIRCFNNFTKANDPYNEHDFLAVLIITVKRYIGKLIIMTRIISFIPQIQAIQI